ncbi:AMIN domain-containing protein [Desulfovibrio ferrophilus]|uniref:Merzoite surface protein 1 n=1 Tax=Desulfovibrio ferrophilus TaxID=241368 RepID=A0A2Z6B058_9BACT|nr:AMIN domain-containing protein [Desulfovibrio ferrophilus]BBD08766.1 merzoite surface protein 1 [Desulfovibrio ferrophilus]
MKCSHCGHDLMLGLVPKGLGKFLPMTTYTCVRCGQVNRRLSESLTQRGPRLLLVLLLIVAVSATAWFALLAPRMQQANSIRREIVTVVEEPAPTVQQESSTDTTPTPAQPASSAQTDAGESPAEATQQAPPPPTEQKTVAEASPATNSMSSTPAIPAPTKPAQVSKDGPKTQDKPAITLPAPAPQQVATAPAAPRPASSDLEEVEVTAPPKASRPAVVGTTQKKKRSSWNATLTGIRSGIWKDALILNLSVKGLAGDPTGFQLSSPPRYVVDVPGSWTYEGDKKVAVGKGGASAIRLGVHSDKLRIVLDLDREPKQASVRRTPDGLTITIR